MNYRSLDDLSLLISRNLHRIPQDVELVVGVPRSGLLPASIIALKANLPLTDLYSFLRNEELRRGKSRSYKMQHLSRPQGARKILLVDDSVSSGRAMKEALHELDGFIAAGGSVVTLAAYAERSTRGLVDIFLELVAQPRMFEWNIMHHPRLADACLDIDGVLCVDPTEEQNDDGVKYLAFLASASPLVIPTVRVKHLVTSRLEKYRGPTEAWLAKHGVQYGTLHMVDLPTAEERRRLNIHHKFKAGVYAADAEATLFVESEKRQALEIMRASNKPVFCTEDQRMYLPGMSMAAAYVSSLEKVARLRRKVMNRLRAVGLRMRAPRHMA